MSPDTVFSDWNSISRFHTFFHRAAPTWEFSMYIFISQDVSYNQEIFHILLHLAFSVWKNMFDFTHFLTLGRINLKIWCKKHCLFHRVFHIHKSFTWVSHELPIGFTGLLPVVNSGVHGAKIFIEHFITHFPIFSHI